jgi:sulfite exporter TauE/SafE
VYIALGLIAGIFSQIALEKFYSAKLTDALFICAGVFILLMGIMMLFDNKIEHNFCKRFQAKFFQKNKYGAIFLGLITGIFPCGPLLGILFFIALISKNYLEGAIFSFSFGLGTFLSPLFILVIFAGAVPKLLVKKPKIYLIFKRISALVICYLGLSLILSVFK